MKSSVLFFAAAALAAAQVIPNRYIVELATEPTASIAAAKHARFSISDREVQARQLEIAQEHATAEEAIGRLGGTVTHHFYHVSNAMAVTMTPEAAQKMAASPGVRSVTPVLRTRIFMDQAINVHRIAQAWQLLSGGSATAGAGIKIGILDTGIDATHPAFQNFSTATPSGFPILSGPATAADVNGKIIVARVYSDLAGGLDNSGTTGTDYAQHGTTVAGIAAGLPIDPKFPGVGLVSGVAPGAWLGNYKVQDDNGEGTVTTFLAGLEDALADGMNVVNYSAGAAVYETGDENGVQARAIAGAVSAGMLVICAAGNEGPSIGSIATPAVSPAAIAVGAIENQRWFWFAVTPAGGKPVYAIPPDEELSFITGDITGQLVDVGTVAGGERHACSFLPANSLTGKIALIQRGSPNSSSCLFQTKLNNAQAAGAVAAIVYDNTSRAFFDYTLSGGDVAPFEVDPVDYAPPVDVNGNDRLVSWSVGSATLPGMLVSQADGATLLSLTGTTVDLDFDGKTPQAYPAANITDFTGVGPTPLANVKPDVVAVGDWLVAPTTTVYEDSSCTAPYTLDLFNGCYPAFTFLDSPYQVDFALGFGYGAYFDDAAGTSFATPIVTGTAALLMSARPGLTGLQYRSLLANSSGEFDLASTGSIASPQSGGGGMLDALGAMQQGLTANPTALNFVSKASGGSSSSIVAAAVHAQDNAAAAPSQAVTITNIGPADTFSVTFNSIDGIAKPSADSTQFKLAAGGIQTINVSLSSGLAPGQYQGYMLVTGTQGQTPLRIPYWYGIAGSTAKNVFILYNPGTDPSACSDVIDFRMQDAVGLPVTPASTPTVTTTATLASVSSVNLLTDIPGTYEAAILTGRADSDGENVFTISADGSSWQVSITIDNSGATPCSGTSSGGAAIPSPASRAKALKTRYLKAPNRRTAQNSSPSEPRQ